MVVGQVHKMAKKKKKCAQKPFSARYFSPLDVNSRVRTLCLPIHIKMEGEVQSAYIVVELPEYEESNLLTTCTEYSITVRIFFF
jgi:hypothetical protein